MERAGGHALRPARSVFGPDEPDLVVLALRQHGEVVGVTRTVRPSPISRTSTAEGQVHATRAFTNSRYARVRHRSRARVARWRSLATRVCEARPRPGAPGATGSPAQERTARRCAPRTRPTPRRDTRRQRVIGSDRYTVRTRRSHAGWRVAARRPARKRAARRCPLTPSQSSRTGRSARASSTTASASASASTAYGPRGHRGHAHLVDPRAARCPAACRRSRPSARAATAATTRARARSPAAGRGPRRRSRSRPGRARSSGRCRPRRA